MGIWVCGMCHHTGLAWVQWPDIACKACGGAKSQGRECPTCRARKAREHDAPALFKPWGSPASDHQQTIPWRKWGNKCS